MGTIVQTVAHQFLDAEYKAGLLDQSTQETLVISLEPRFRRKEERI